MDNVEILAFVHFTVTIAFFLQTTDEEWNPCIIKEAVTQIYKVTIKL